MISLEPQTEMYRFLQTVSVPELDFLRGFAMQMRDAPWSSSELRAMAMRNLVGSADGLSGDTSREGDTNREATLCWRMVMSAVRVLVPIALRSHAWLAANHEEFEATARQCEAVTDLASAEAAARAVNIPLNAAGVCAWNAIKALECGALGTAGRFAARCGVCAADAACASAGGDGASRDGVLVKTVWLLENCMVRE